MLGEHGVRALVVAEVPDPEAIMGYEGMQRGGKLAEGRLRLKLPVERPRDGLETDEELRLRLLRPGVCRGRIHARLPGGILSENLTRRVSYGVFMLTPSSAHSASRTFQPPPSAL